MTMESEGVCPATTEEPTLTVQISWGQVEETSLVQLYQDLPSGVRGSARSVEIRRRWNEANLTLPSIAAALSIQMRRG